MNDSTPTRARQVALAACDFERERTGRLPSSVAVVLGGETLVVTLRGVLSPAELAVARTPTGAALLRDFYRELFDSACEPLQQQVARITAVDVREAAAELHTATGIVVLTFLLTGEVPAETWGGFEPGD